MWLEHYQVMYLAGSEEPAMKKPKTAGEYVLVQLVVAVCVCVCWCSW